MKVPLRTSALIAVVCFATIGPYRTLAQSANAIRLTGPSLVDQLQHGTSQEQIVAAKLLATWGRVDLAGSALLGALQTGASTELSQSIALSLARRGYTDAEPILRSTLDPFRPEAKAMVTALGVLGRRESVPKLIGLWQYPHLRDEVTFALMRMGHKSEELVLPVLKDPWLSAQALRVLCFIGSRKVQTFLSESFDTFPKDRTRIESAVTAMSQRVYSEAFPSMLRRGKYLADHFPHELHRATIIHAQSAEGKGLLSQAIRAAHGKLKSILLAAWWDIEGEGFGAEISRVLTQQGFLSILGTSVFRKPNALAVPWLVKLAKERPTLRDVALNALARVHNRAAIAALLSLCGKQSNNHGATGLFVAMALRRQASVISGTDPSLIRRCLDKPSQASSVWLRAISLDSSVRSMLLNLLRSSDVDDRRYGLSGLAALGDSSAVQDIKRMLRSEGRLEVIRQAWAALADLRFDAKVFSEDMTIWTDAYLGPVVLIASGRWFRFLNAKQKLFTLRQSLRALRDSDPAMRCAAIVGIGLARQRHLWRSLWPLLWDRDAHVAATAMTWLPQLVPSARIAEVQWRLEHETDSEQWILFRTIREKLKEAHAPQPARFDPIFGVSVESGPHDLTRANLWSAKSGWARMRPLPQGELIVLNASFTDHDSQVWLDAIYKPIKAY